MHLFTYLLFNFYIALLFVIFHTKLFIVRCIFQYGSVRCIELVEQMCFKLGVKVKDQAGYLTDSGSTLAFLCLPMSYLRISMYAYA